MAQQSGRNVHVEGFKAVLLGEVRVPSPHHRPLGQLAQEEAVHPAKGELDVQQPFLRDVSVKISWRKRERETERQTTRDKTQKETEHREAGK